MRFTITALGCSGASSVAGAVADVVRYLHGRPVLGTPAHSASNGDQPGRYYSDSGEGAGRWLGLGADELGVAGLVDDHEFAQVLAGRHPRTGERLITAQGSAGRTATLGVGTETRRTANGERLYDLADVAVCLNLEPGDVDELVTAGERAAFEQLLALSGAGGDVGRVDGAMLVPCIDADGARLITETELARVEAARGVQVSAATVLAGGGADDQLSVAAAAAIVGVSRQYLRGLCRRYLGDAATFDAAEADGEIHPRAYVRAVRRGRSYRITRTDLAALAERRVPPAVRFGYDLTATTEKSLSVLGLLGDSDTRDAVLVAIQAGNDTGLSYLEQHAAGARAGGERVGVTGWTVASFRHHTSRRLDPFVHHHNVVANTVLDEHGTRRALDARGLYQHRGAASALATAQMRYELTSAIGVAWRAGPGGAWEIDGIGDDAVTEFSQRSNEIAAAVAELEATIGRSATLDEKEAAVADTRPDKSATTAGELLDSWWSRAAGHGLTPDTLRACAARRRPAQLTAEHYEEVFETLDAALTAHASTFARADVVDALVALPLDDGQPLIVPAAEIVALADTYLASSRVIELAEGQERGRDTIRRRDGQTIAAPDTPPEFTTPEMLAVQGAVIAGYDARLDDGSAVVDPDVLAQVLAEHPTLSDEQRRFVEVLCTSGDGIASGIGQPGTGKTFTMAAAAAAWTAAGYRVVGTAVKGEAARLLATEAAIPAETLAWYLAHDDPDNSAFDARTVVIVDEASTIGDRDLHQLITMAARSGAALRFVGDHAQHGSVPAGGMWRLLAQRNENRTPELSEGRRLRSPADIAAAVALRAGRVGDALTALDQGGHLHVMADDTELYREMLTAWYEARRNGDTYPMVERRNDNRQVLNRLAHRLLQSVGDVAADEVATSDGRRFAVGDQLVARRPSRDLHPPGAPERYIRNGSLGSVAALDPDGPDPALLVDFADLGRIRLPLSFVAPHTYGDKTVAGAEHAYALTSYAIQGTTNNQSSSRIDPRSTRAETYVDITRGRRANHLYITDLPDRLDGEQLPTLAPDPILTRLARRLTDSGPERPALELDPDAVPVAALAHGRSLASLAAQARADTGAGRDTTLIDRAEAARAAQVARAALADPEPALLARLPARPAAPHLAHRFDTAVTAVAVYRARWNPRAGTGPWEWALGTAATGGDAQRRERHATITLLADAARGALRDQLTRAGHQPGHWVDDHLDTITAAGAGVVDITALARLYRNIGDYRDHHDPGEDTAGHPDPIERILGPDRGDAARAGLAAELAAITTSATATHAAGLG